MAFKKGLIVCAVIGLALVTGATSAFAFGMGFYGSLGSESGDWTKDEWFGTVPGIPQPMKMKHNDRGIVLDTNLAKSRLFNYRLELGRAEMEVKDVNSFFDDRYPSAIMKIDGFVLNHTFGFGAPITRALRFWLGPEIRFTWMDGSLSADPNVDLDLFGFGFGAATGLNINLPGPITLGIKAGYSVMNYTGEGMYWDTVSGAYTWRDYDVDEDYSYVTVMFMFRTPGDR